MIELIEIGFAFVIINVLTILTLLYMAYDDWKTREVEVSTVIILIVLGLTSLLLSFFMDIITFNDIIVISFVSLTTLALIWKKQMAVGDIGLIGVVMAMPFATALSLLFFSIFTGISTFKGIKTQPFYTLFGVAFVMAILIMGFNVIEKPHVCEQLTPNTLNFSDGYCTTPFVLYQGSIEYRQPTDYSELNIQFNKTVV